ncbi:hypothetical protein [Aquimarina sp. AU119]|uniref:hypothetical protein n=1 Tax=Aquimarina sp. AU119 TaxID=2108528 RepID=UPI000D689BBB|nr:hypothetical protein [Aquimarina sp. AU119]
MRYSNELFLRFKTVFIAFIGVFSTLVLLRIILNNAFLIEKIVEVTSSLSRLKVWWIIILFVIVILTLSKHKSVGGYFTILVTIPLVAVLVAITILRRSQDGTVISEFINTVWYFTLLLMLLSLVMITISKIKTFLKYFVYIVSILLILFFFARFIFFEEIFFSKANDTENQIIVGRFLLLLLLFIWLIISINPISLLKQSESTNGKRNDVSESMVILLLGMFYVSVYFFICKDVLDSETCKAVNFDCVTKLWEF